MMKNLFALIVSVLLLCSCAKEFNAVYKSNDYQYKLEYAKAAYAKGKYQQASTLLGDIITMFKGTDQAEESLFMYGMSLYKGKDYEVASDVFKRYYTTYPKGKYTEMAYFYAGETLYEGTPEPRLDQSPTYAAIKAYQDYLDIYPEATMKEKTQDRLIELQDKLVEKEYLNAKLYYNLGTYFGNCLTGGSNYEACVITAENALKDYPYMSRREDFAILIMKAKFELAQQSVESKALERYQNAEDECYGFINEYPNSKERVNAEKYIEICKKHTGE